MLYHGNLLTKRDMTDVADSSRVMVDLVQVSTFLLQMQSCGPRHTNVQVAAAGSVYNVCSNRAVPVIDMLRILLSFSPIGDSIALQPRPDRFRSFDERVLLVTLSQKQQQRKTYLHLLQGDNSKLVEGMMPPTFKSSVVAGIDKAHFDALAATGWQPSTAFNDTVLSVLEYWRREIRARYQVS